MNPFLRVGHLVSGNGTTMTEVARRMLSGELGDICPVVVIADRPCGALDRARELGIPAELISKSVFPGEQWGQKIEHKLTSYSVDIVFQNGWLPLTPSNIITRWPDIFNQHPGPLSGNGTPDFGGRGMYGIAVTAARMLYLLEIGERDPSKLSTESTIHRVALGIDEGSLVRVQMLNIAEHIAACRTRGIVDIETAFSHRDNFDTLVRVVQKGLLTVEYENVSQVVYSLGHGIGIQVGKDSDVSYDISVLERAKMAAIQMYTK